MFDELRKYKNQDHFFFRKGECLKTLSSDVPELAGVYYIMRLSKGRIDLVYMGASAIIMQNGKCRIQGLNTSLNSVYDDLPREEYLTRKCTEEEIDGLDIYWFVTMDKKNQDLPGYVLGLIMQRYFDVFNVLPLWNKSY
jgi:hypothetical protein